MRRLAVVTVLIGMLLGALAVPAIAWQGGARSAAIGGAYTGLAEGPEGAYWNPAGLAWISSREVGGTLPTDGLASNAFPFFVAYTQPNEGMGAGALWWARSTSSLPGDGTLIADSLAYSYSLKVSSAVSAGATLRLQSERSEFPGVTLPEAQGVGLDFGLLYRATSRLTAGATVKDITGTPLSSDSGLVSEMPLDVRVGASYRLTPSATVSLDLTDALNNSLPGTGFAGGLELVVNPAVRLRGGVTAIDGSYTWSVGAGYETASWRADLAYVSADDAEQGLLSVAVKL